MALAPDDWIYQVHSAYLQLFWKGETTALEKVLTRSPSSYGPAGFVTKGRFHIALLLRKYKEAEQMLLQDPQENFYIGPLSPIPKSFLFGQLYYRSGDEAKARAFFEKARPSIEQSVQQRPLEGVWHLAVAEVYAGLGRKEDAIREGKRATELIPEAKVPADGLTCSVALLEFTQWLASRISRFPLPSTGRCISGGLLVEYVRMILLWTGCAAIRISAITQKYGGK